MGGSGGKAVSPSYERTASARSAASAAAFGWRSARSRASARRSTRRSASPRGVGGRRDRSASSLTIWNITLTAESARYALAPVTIS